MPVVTDPKDPNWGLDVPAATSAPRAMVTDPSDPNWGLPVSTEEGQPHFAAGNELDPQGNPVVRGIESAWQFANTPLVPQIATGAHALADVVDRPLMGDQQLNDRIPGLGTLSAMIRGGGAGMIQGAGDLTASFTSPLGVALWLAGQGETSALAKYLPAIKPYLDTATVKALQRTVQGVAGAGMTGEGAHTVLKAQTRGDVGRGLTQMAAGIAGVVSAVAPRPTAATPARREPRLTPQEQAANAFAAQYDIPLDAATATGSRTARAMQKRAANSMGGEGTASDLIARQQQGLTAAGRQIAGAINPALGGQPGPSVSPEQAGRAAPAALVDLITARNTEATQSYEGLRALEADPRYAGEVPAPRPSQQAADAVAQRMRSSLGYAPNPGELNELRRMAEEMGGLPYVGRTWNDLSAEAGPKRGNAAGGSAEIVAGAAGAPVYDDILKSLRSSDYVPTRGHVERMMRETLDTGQFNEVSRAAFDVAQRRLANDPSVSKPVFAPSAGEVPEPLPITMGMPVAIKPLQDAMRPDFERLQADHAVAPLMGDKAEALRRLARLMAAPEYVPVSVADSVLGDLKTISRAAVPALRTEGQAIAAKAVQALSTQVDEIVSQVPGAADLLRQGRAATVAKYRAADTLSNVPDKPVQAFDRLTAPRDQEIDLLRAVERQTPDVVPQLGRAKLEQWLDLATEKGRFDHADRLYAEWQKMGDETKRVLFGTPERVKALDDFFLLAKRMSENPNPSGTAHTMSAFNVGATIGTWPLAKLLYTDGGVRALTGFLKLDPSVASRTVSGAAREAAWARVTVAAQQAGVTVPLQFPRAAQADSPDPADRRLAR